jgi:uncharacterized membrane protein
MKKKLLIISFFLIGIITFNGCANDSSDDLLDIEVNDQVTYTEHIKSIIDNNCVVCHAAVPINFAPMPLTTYENVKEAIQNRGLLDRISRAQGMEGLMPYNGTRLPQGLIDLVYQWDSDGLLE